PLFKSASRDWFLVPCGTGLQLNNPPQQKEIKKMTSPHSRKSIGRSPVWRAFLLIPLVLACFALAQLPATGTHNGVLDRGNTPLGVAIITFDAPGAGTGPGQGTIPYAINQASTIAGSDLDASNVYHGFLRAAGGTITVFDAPGAGSGPCQGT